MTIYKKMCEEKYIEWLKTGEKPVEVRLATDEFLNCNRIIWTVRDTNNKYSSTVINRKIFDTFEDCLNYYGFKKLICDSSSYDECLKIYKSFYPNKDYLNHKIVALSLDFN
jgi:ASC-1-like (ASCH) protein